MLMHAFNFVTCVGWKVDGTTCACIWCTTQHGRNHVQQLCLPLDVWMAWPVCVCVCGFNVYGITMEKKGNPFNFTLINNAADVADTVFTRKLLSLVRFPLSIVFACGAAAFFTIHEFITFLISNAPAGYCSNWLTHFGLQHTHTHTRSQGEKEQQRKRND